MSYGAWGFAWRQLCAYIKSFLPELGAILVVGLQLFAPALQLLLESGVVGGLQQLLPAVDEGDGQMRVCVVEGAVLDDGDGPVHDRLPGLGRRVHAAAVGASDERHGGHQLNEVAVLHTVGHVSGGTQAVLGDRVAHLDHVSAGVPLTRAGADPVRHLQQTK